MIGEKVEQTWKAEAVKRGAKTSVQSRPGAQSRRMVMRMEVPRRPATSIGP